jgi:hypothetical protein
MEYMISGLIETIYIKIPTIYLKEISVNVISFAATKISLNFNPIFVGVPTGLQFII